MQKEKVRKNLWFGLFICLGATTLATVSWINGNYQFYGINCYILGAASMLCFINYGFLHKDT